MTMTFDRALVVAPRAESGLRVLEVVVPCDDRFEVDASLRGQAIAVG